jgi:DNA polymerase/3'-5' exonuclease PolX
MHDNTYELLKFNLEQKCLFYKCTGDTWKQKAYDNALSTFRANADKNINTEDDIKKIKLGKNITARCIWMLQNKRNLPDVDEQHLNIQAIETLSKVYNIGTKKASELVNKHNILTVTDLASHAHLLNDKQKVGLKYHHQIVEKIPYAEIVLHAKLLEKYVHDADVHTPFEIVGSFRRQASYSGDIDVIIRSQNPNVLKCIVSRMQLNNYVPVDGVLALGAKKFMGICRIDDDNIYRRIDILVTNVNEYPFALLYFTGCKEFNVKFREHAKSKGFQLNEKMLYRISDKIAINLPDEKAIFDVLGVQYIPPNMRYVHNFKILGSSSNTVM